jgi:hypothetical protein
MMRMRLLLTGLTILIVSACGLFPRAIPTEPPFCAPLADSLGSVQLDYEVRPLTLPAVSAAAAEAAARAVFGNAGTTCSVRLAKYDNLSDHRALVWVVHLDGLALPGAGGALAIDGRPQPSPPVLRRALTIITVDEPPTPILTIASGR